MEAGAPDSQESQTGRTADTMIITDRRPTATRPAGSLVGTSENVAATRGGLHPLSATWGRPGPTASGRRWARTAMMHLAEEGTGRPPRHPGAGTGRQGDRPPARDDPTGRRLRWPVAGARRVLHELEPQRVGEEGLGPVLVAHVDADAADCGDHDDQPPLRDGRDGTCLARIIGPRCAGSNTNRSRPHMTWVGWMRTQDLGRPVRHRTWVGPGAGAPRRGVGRPVHLRCPALRDLREAFSPAGRAQHRP